MKTVEEALIVKKPIGSKYWEAHCPECRSVFRAKTKRGVSHSLKRHLDTQHTDEEEDDEEVPYRDSWIHAIYKVVDKNEWVVVCECKAEIYGKTREKAIEHFRSHRQANHEMDEEPPSEKCRVKMSRTVEINYCYRCGTIKKEENANFCPQCGSNISKNVSHAISRATEEEL